MPGRSMNVFTVEVMDELEAIYQAVATDAGVKGAVISGKESFSGGADLNVHGAAESSGADFIRGREAEPEAARW